MSRRNFRRNRTTLLLAFALALFAAPSPAGRAPSAARLSPVEEDRRDPLGVVRTATRPRVWILLDTSTSMTDPLTEGISRFDAAREVIRQVVETLESETGEPLAHWRLGVFETARDPTPAEALCEDPTAGAGLPDGPVFGVPESGVRRAHLRILSDPPGCDAQADRSALLRAIPAEPEALFTPNGIALYQLAAHIRETATDDLAPGQKNIIVLITDGLDTCECWVSAWRDFNDGPPGPAEENAVWLRTSAASPEPVRHADPFWREFTSWNAGLKAKAAFLALNRGDPDAGLGDIHVVGVDMVDETLRAYTNHLGWMASYGRRPAIHADRPETLRRVLDEVVREVTLPSGEVRLAAPRLATIKELVASSPNPAFPGSDPALIPAALVAPADAGPELQRVLRRRAAYRDNVLLSTAADLGARRGRLRAIPTGGGARSAAVWDAGERLAARDPADRLVLFNRPGSTELLAFRVGVVTSEDLGVAAGYLAELDGVGAQTAADAAEIVVRLVRGEELSVHPDTGTIYGRDGRLNFDGGRDTWKLREGLASPVAVTNPPRPPERVTRQSASYRSFHTRHLNRRTMVYLPTSGGVLHGFAGDTGEEVFAYIPDDVLGPPTGAAGGASGSRAFLRDLAVAGVRGAPGLHPGLVNRFTLAGSPVVRDVFQPEARTWRTVLAFGRSVGGRFVTALDVTDVGGRWAGNHRPPRPRAGGPGMPQLLFNRGGPGGALAGLGETPEPLLAEAPGLSGSEWFLFLPGGQGSPGDDSGEWLFALSVADGRVRFQRRLPPAASPAIPKNSAVTSAAGWQPSWAVPGAPDLVTRVYVADLHGQIHRLDLADPRAWRWEVAHRLGGNHPVLTPPVVFPFPGRVEPHLLVVAGGDPRVRDTPPMLVLLRDEGTRFRELWRRTLGDGELPQGKPVVLLDGAGVSVALATRTVARDRLSCNVTTTTDGVARVRSFDGLTGAPLSGVVDPTRSVVSYGRGRVRGLSLSASGNLALSVSGIAGDVLDTVIGDFEFRVRDAALEDVTLFVEGFRRSPFWVR